MTKKISFVVFCLGMVFAAFGCVDMRDHVKFDRGGQFHFEDLDHDRDGYITETYADGCARYDGAEQYDQCMDTLDENGTPRNGDSHVSSETYKLQGMLDCDDNDATVYPGAPELCDNKDNDCDGVVDDGIVCDCMTNPDCDDGVYCNGQETCEPDHTCQPGYDPCSAELVCDEATDSCEECLDSDDCEGGQLCDSDTNTCVDCLNSTDCDDGLYCNGSEICGMGGVCLLGAAPCVETVCDEESNACVDCLNSTDCDDGLYCNGQETCGLDHTCQPGSDPCLEGRFCQEASDTCVGCVYDSDCDSTRPSDLGADYLWGCSTGTLPPDNVHLCTSCLDADHDSWCAAEVCGNDLDDDGDGVVDETECEPSDICDLYGAWIKNVGCPPELVDFDVLYHTYTFGWLLVVPENHLEYPYQNFAPLVLHEGVKFGGDCILGVDVIPSELYTRDVWLAKTNTQQQAVCEAHFLCYNAQEQPALPVINPADPEHSCFCPYNATPLVP